MSLIKWEPFDEFDRMMRDFSSLPALRMNSMGFDLAVDLYEDGGDLVAEMQIPGMKGEDIEVEVVGDNLRIAGKREEVTEKKEKSHYAKEIRRGSFERVIALPTAVERDGVRAEYKNGMLTVRMPRQAEGEDNRVKVEVK